MHTVQLTVSLLHCSSYTAQHGTEFSGHIAVILKWKNRNKTQILHNLHKMLCADCIFFPSTGHASVLMSFFFFCQDVPKHGMSLWDDINFQLSSEEGTWWVIQWLIYAVCLSVCLCNSCRSTETWGAPSLRVTTPSTRRRCRWPRMGRSPAGCWGTGIKESRPTSCVKSSISKNNIFLWIFHFLRTEWFECHGDVDFLAKLHCVREACQVQLNPL